MTRRLGPLGAADVVASGGACPGCVYWESAEPAGFVCGALHDTAAQRTWFALVHERWGECGRVAYDNDEVLGFIKYAPLSYLPQAANFPVRAPAPADVLIACMRTSGSARGSDTGRLLLHAALKDLHERGERRVYAYATTRAGDDDRGLPMAGADFLLAHGFTVDQPHPVYPLLRLDLRSLVAIKENLEAVLGSLRARSFRRRVACPSVDRV